jgi:hypothetical protein
MDIRFLDVAIGLALVFAITSLLTTALQEAWTAIRGTRGAVLRKAIESFVGDDPGFAQALLDHPLLVSLSPQPLSEKQKRRPSYIGADAVVAALVGHLAQHQAGGQRPATPALFVDTVLRAAKPSAGPATTHGAGAASVPLSLAPNPEFARGLAALAIGVEQDWPAFEARLVAWFDAVGARSSGWFKRRVQGTVFVFGLLTAAVVNINPIVIGARLWGDDVLRETVVGIAEKTVAARDAAAPAVTGAAPAPTPATSTEAAPAAAASAPLLEVQRRLTEALGQPAADAQQSAALLAAADRYKALRDGVEAWQRAAAGDRTGAAARAQAALDELQRSVPTRHQALLDSLASLRSALTTPAPAATRASVPAAAASASGVPGAAVPALLRRQVCRQPVDDATRDICLQLNQLATLQQAGLPLGWVPPARPMLLHESCATADGNALSDGSCPGNAHPTLAWWGNTLGMLAGWLITALACTLGAPFWFDALGRLVKMRSSGTKPGDAAPAAGAAGTPPPTLLSRSTAPAADTAVPLPMSDAVNDAERKLTRPEIERVQRHLPMPETEVSGWFDGATRRAIQSWQDAQGFSPASGELSPEQIARLLSMP